MTTTTKRLRVRTLGELLAVRFPPREFLLEPVLRQGESAMVWAPTGVGKTMLTLTVALAVAGSFLGWSASKPRRVLVVDGEMAREDIQERLVMLAATIDGFDAEAAAQNLAVIARTDQERDVKFPDISKEDDQERIIREADQHHAELIILDNFSTLADVADENEASAMDPVLHFLLKLKGRRQACILVHHSGKAGNTYRGSSKLATTFEVIMGLTRRDDAGADTGTRFKLTFDKFRGTPSDDLRPRKVALERGFAGEQWVAEADEADAVEKVLRALQSGRFVNQKEIAEALGMSTAGVSRAFAGAAANGRLSKKQRDEAFEAAADAKRAESGGEESVLEGADF